MQIAVFGTQRPVPRDLQFAAGADGIAGHPFAVRIGKAIASIRVFEMPERKAAETVEQQVRRRQEAGAPDHTDHGTESLRLIEDRVLNAGRINRRLRARHLGGDIAELRGLDLAADHEPVAAEIVAGKQVGLHSRRRAGEQGILCDGTDRAAVDDPRIVTARNARAGTEIHTKIRSRPAIRPGRSERRRHRRHRGGGTAAAELVDHADLADVEIRRRPACRAGRGYAREVGDGINRVGGDGLVAVDVEMHIAIFTA